MPESEALAIVAGGGQLPLRVAEAARANGREVLVIALDGLADANFGSFPKQRFRIGQAGAIIRALREADCRDVVLIGSVRRPDRWRADVGVSLFWTLIKNLDLLWSGDATLLSRLVQVVEREGLRVRGAHEVAPQLLLPAGDHARARPNERDRRDIEVGVRAAAGIGALDIGQGVVVARGRVLAAEAAEGTDGMLERAATLNRHEAGVRVGVLVKWPQPIQDLRVDLPTIGPETVRLAAAAGLAGLAVAGERVLAVDVDDMIALADQHGMFLTALDASSAAGAP